jgi:hypothetical protein
MGRLDRPNTENAVAIVKRGEVGEAGGRGNMECWDLRFQAVAGEPEEGKRSEMKEKKNRIRIDGKEFLWRERELVVWSCGERIFGRQDQRRSTTTILFLKQIERASQLVLKYQKYVTVFPKRTKMGSFTSSTDN